MSEAKDMHVVAIELRPDQRNLDRYRASILSPTRDLLLVDLSGKALHKLGIPRARLLESDAALGAASK